MGLDQDFYKLKKDKIDYELKPREILNYYEGFYTKENNIVYRNEVKLGQTEVKINNSIINDPTYARTFGLRCPRCGYNETICFQNPNINDAGMKFIYVCCNKDYNGEPCGHNWFKEESNSQ